MLRFLHQLSPVRPCKAIQSVHNSPHQPRPHACCSELNSMCQAGKFHLFTKNPTMNVQGSCYSVHKSFINLSFFLEAHGTTSFSCPILSNYPTESTNDSPNTVNLGARREQTLQHKFSWGLYSNFARLGSRRRVKKFFEI